MNLMTLNGIFRNLPKKIKSEFNFFDHQKPFYMWFINNDLFDYLKGSEKT